MISQKLNETKILFLGWFFFTVCITFRSLMSSVKLFREKLSFCSSTLPAFFFGTGGSLATWASLIHWADGFSTSNFGLVFAKVLHEALLFWKIILSGGFISILHSMFVKYSFGLVLLPFIKGASFVFIFGSFLIDFESLIYKKRVW